jgi:hypothetical protein
MNETGTTWTTWTIKEIYHISTDYGKKIRRFGKFGNEKVI